jgi:hypothetical protein
MYSIGGLAEFFHQKNGPQKCCYFADLQQRTESCKKLIFYLKKALPMLRNMPKMALF